ncbi:hypothetical protein Tco_0934318 [Tanacetum coccineum]
MRFSIWNIMKTLRRYSSDIAISKMLLSLSDSFGSQLFGSLCGAARNRFALLIFIAVIVVEESLVSVIFLVCCKDLLQYWCYSYSEFSNHALITLVGSS